METRGVLCLMKVMYWLLGNWSIFLTGRDMVLGGGGGAVGFAIEGEILAMVKRTQHKSSGQFMKELMWTEAIRL